MKKYRIIKQISGGLPYSVKEFEDFHKCYMFFKKMIKIEDENVRELRSFGYYVVNDFYKNEFQLSKDVVKIKIEKKRGKYWYCLRLQDI